MEICQTKGVVKDSLERTPWKQPNILVVKWWMKKRFRTKKRVRIPGGFSAGEALSSFAPNTSKFEARTIAGDARRTDWLPQFDAKNQNDAVRLNVHNVLTRRVVQLRLKSSECYRCRHLTWSEDRSPACDCCTTVGPRRQVYRETGEIKFA